MKKLPRKITITEISGFWKKEGAPCQAEMGLATPEMNVEVFGRATCGEPAEYSIRMNDTPQDILTRGFVCAEHVGNLIEWWVRRFEVEEVIDNVG